VRGAREDPPNFTPTEAVFTGKDEGEKPEANAPDGTPAPNPPTSTPSASGQSPRRPILRANPYPEVTDPFCRLPLSTLFYSTRGCSPWRPAAVISTTWHE
jgi:hypothetical protein